MWRTHCKENREKHERYCGVSISYISVKFIKLRAVLSFHQLESVDPVSTRSRIKVSLSFTRTIAVVSLHLERHIRGRRRESYRRKKYTGENTVHMSLPNFRANQGSPGCTGWRMNISSASDKPHELPPLFRRGRHRERENNVGLT